MISALEAQLVLQMRAVRLPTASTEFVFAPPRKFRFDFAWPEIKLAVEVEGGTWGKSRHTTGVGFGKDCVKYNLAALDGWVVLRFTCDMVRTGEAVRVIGLALATRRNPGATEIKKWSP